MNLQTRNTLYSAFNNYEDAISKIRSTRDKLEVAAFHADVDRETKTNLFIIISKLNVVLELIITEKELLDNLETKMGTLPWFEQKECKKRRRKEGED